MFATTGIDVFRELAIRKIAAAEILLNKEVALVPESLGDAVRKEDGEPESDKQKCGKVGLGLQHQRVAG